MKEKTELARKLGVGLKNTEAKFKVDKRKLEIEVDKLKEKMNQLSRRYNYYNSVETTLRKIS